MKAETTENFVISLSPSSTFPSSTCYEKKLKATNGTLHKPENVASISRCVFPARCEFFVVKSFVDLVLMGFETQGGGVIFRTVGISKRKVRKV
jgi:hypothetical protein